MMYSSPGVTKEKIWNAPSCVTTVKSCMTPWCIQCLDVQSPSLCVLVTFRPYFSVRGQWVTKMLRPCDKCTPKSHKILLACDKCTAKQTTCSVSPKSLIGSHENWNRLFIHITWSHCNVGQPNFVTSSPKDVSYLDMFICWSIKEVFCGMPGDPGRELLSENKICQK
jgi:hypothetical protein